MTFGAAIQDVCGVLLGYCGLSGGGGQKMAETCSCSPSVLLVEI